MWNSAIIVYQSQYAGTNKATSATWKVGEDMDALVKELKSKGVRLNIMRCLIQH